MPPYGLTRRTAHRRAGESLAAGYTAGWTVLLAVSAVCALVPAARSIAHYVLSLDLHVHIHPAPRPTLITAVGLLLNNVRATGWPLLAATLGPGCSTLLRRVTHTHRQTGLIAASMLVALNGAAFLEPWAVPHR